MAFEYPGNGALDYFPCRYADSRLMFRGPRRVLDRDYVAAFGGSATYGRFVVDPWPASLEGLLGVPVVNLGCLNAGVDTFVREEILARLGRAAKVSVVQLVGAGDLSNSYYYVHPRRNDRFLTETGRMRELFPGVDFTEFTFTRHMLHTLRARDPAAFDLLARELREVWLRQMTRFISRLGGTVVLLLIGDVHEKTDVLADEPVLVTRDMIEQVSKSASALVHVRPSDAVLAAGTTGMYFAPMEAPAAAAMPGPLFHMEISDALVETVRDFL